MWNNSAWKGGFVLPPFLLSCLSKEKMPTYLFLHTHLTHTHVYIHPPQSHQRQKSQRKTPSVTPGVTPRAVPQAIPVCFAEGHRDQRVIFKISHQLWRDSLGVSGGAVSPCWELQLQEQLFTGSRADSRAFPGGSCSWAPQLMQFICRWAGGSRQRC